jgi:hypothetical protein
MSRATKTILLFVLGVAFIFPFTYPVTLAIGVAFLVAFVVYGLFTVASPEFLEGDRED